MYVKRVCQHSHVTKFILTVSMCNDYESLMYPKVCESSYLNSFTAQSTCYIIRAVSQLTWYLCQSGRARGPLHIVGGKECSDWILRDDGGAAARYLFRYLFANIVAQCTAVKIGFDAAVTKPHFLCSFHDNNNKDFPAISIKF